MQERPTHQKMVNKKNSKQELEAVAERFAAREAARESAGNAGRPLLFEGDIDMRITRDGRWHYKGSPIERPALVKLFASVLKCDDSGGYWLVTPVERARIQVEDAPFLAVELRIEGKGEAQRLTFRSNLDEEATAGPTRPLRVSEDPDSGEPRPYLLFRDGLEALITRPVFYELAALAVPDARNPDRLGVWSDGVFFDLGKAQ